MADGNPKRVVSLTMFNWMAATFRCKSPKNSPRVAHKTEAKVIEKESCLYYSTAAISIGAASLAPFCCLIVVY
jgi:hypothetical protein